MKNNTLENSDQVGRLSPQKQLSFYEENYILEPDDYEVDYGYFLFEGEVDEDDENYYRIAN